MVEVTVEKHSGKLGALLFCLLFALGFGAGGIFGGVLPLGEILRNAWASRSWQPVQAVVLQAELETGRKGTAQVHAHYRYQFDGRSYEGTRVGTAGGGSDNVGTWHRDWFHRLDNAKDAGRTVTAWVDPARPYRALLDRSVRWGMVAFHIPFAILFTGIGLAATWGFCYLLVTPAAMLKKRRSLQRNMAEDQRVRSAGHWLLALFWCVLSFPMAALVWLEPQPLLPRVLVSLFALAGLWLLERAFTMARRRRSSMDRTSAS